MTIVCPICFVWTSGCDNTDTSASAEIPQADSRHGDEKQALSRPCRSPAIFHYQFGFMLSVLRPICSISRVPGAEQHSSTRRMSGVGRQKEWGWMEANDSGCICAASPPVSCSTFIAAALFLKPPAPGKWFAPPRASFKPHYLQTM